LFFGFVGNSLTMEQPSRPRPPPPPPGKRGSAVQSNSSETNESVAIPSRPSPPPPPVSKRASLDSSSSVGEETSPMRPAQAAPPVPKKPPRQSEIKTIPVEKALQSVLDQHGGHLEDPILAERSHSPVRPGEEHDHFNKSSSYSSNPFGSNDVSTHNNLAVDTENPTFPRGSQQVAETAQPLVKSPNKGQPENLIYHKTTFSELWFCIFLTVHVIQFALLLSSARSQLPASAMVIIVLLVVAVIVLVILSRFYVKKSRLSSYRNLRLKRGIRTPDDEADEVDDRAVYLLCTACILEGLSFAIFAAVVAGRSSHLNDGGFYTQDTILQILRFASITLLCLHRIIRPANRIDPMRTVLEVSASFIFIFNFYLCFL
jgi:hypothetical protein